MIQARAIDVGLQVAWPDAACELRAHDAWRFLVAVICSARTSDTRVNQVMASLDEHLVGIAAYAAVELDALERLLHRLPLWRQKARAIREAARTIRDRHGGEVPRDPTALARLPGVGPKTAAVVAGNWFGIPAIAVDQHVQRTVHRLGLSRAERPAVIEADLARRFPPDRWVQLCHQLIRLGREHCRPMRPWCSRCPLAPHCAQHDVTDAR